MQVYRRFRLAPALARLLRKEHGIDERFAEGHFAAHPDREHYVSIAPDHSHLVIKSLQAGANGAEERTEVPRTHAEALLDVCAGRIAYGRTSLHLSGAGEGWAEHFLKPGLVDLLTLTFASATEAEAFRVPRWAGPEVTDDPAYNKRSIALHGAPHADEVPLSNAALNALLDVLEYRAPLSWEASTPREAARATAEFGEIASAPLIASPSLEVSQPSAPDHLPAAHFGEQVGDRHRDSGGGEPETAANAASQSEPGPLEQVLSNLSESLARHEAAEAAPAGGAPAEAEPAEAEPAPSRVRSGWELKRPRSTARP